MSERSLPRLPIEPLVRVVELAGGVNVVFPDCRDPSKRDRASRNAHRAFDRCVQRGFCTMHAADLLAVQLGTHPALIWGDAWFAPYLEVAS